MTMISRVKPKIIEKYGSHVANGNGVYTFCIHRSCYYMTMISSLIPKIIENMVFHVATGTVYTHSVYTLPVTI